MNAILRGIALWCLLCGIAFGQAANLSGTVIASAAQTSAQVNSTDQTNSSFMCGHIIVTVSAYTSGNYTPKLQAKDAASGNYYDILVGLPMSGTGTQVLKVCPSVGQIVNGATADFLPRIWRVQLNGLSTPSMTFSVGLNLNFY